MTEQLTKTTVYLDKYLLFLSKKRALEEGKTLKQVIKEALGKHLGITLAKAPSKKINFGGYDLGKIKGKLTRQEIYERF